MGGAYVAMDRRKTSSDFGAVSNNMIRVRKELSRQIKRENRLIKALEMQVRKRKRNLEQIENQKRTVDRTIFGVFGIRNDLVFITNETVSEPTWSSSETESSNEELESEVRWVFVFSRAKLC